MPRKRLSSEQLRLKRLRDYFETAVLGKPNKRLKRFTIEQIHQIIALHARGYGIKPLARMFNTTPATIKYWVNPTRNLRWKELHNEKELQYYYRKGKKLRQLKRQREKEKRGE